MITEEFKSTLKALGIENDKINHIENYLLINKGRVNPDSIQYPDGSIYYSEEYLKEMISRSKINGISEGQREPVIHKVEPICLCNFLSRKKGSTKLVCDQCGREFNFYEEK